MIIELMKMDSLEGSAHTPMYNHTILPLSKKCEFVQGTLYPRFVNLLACDRKPKVFAAANYAIESDCGKALHPNVLAAAPFMSS